MQSSSPLTEAQPTSPFRCLATRAHALRFAGWIIVQAVIARAIYRIGVLLVVDLLPAWSPRTVAAISLAAALLAWLAPVAVGQWRGARGRDVRDAARVHLDDETSRRCEGVVGSRLWPKILVRTARPSRTLWLRGSYHLLLEKGASESRMLQLLHELRHVVHGDPLVRALTPYPGALAAVAVVLAVGSRLLEWAVPVSPQLAVHVGVALAPPAFEGAVVLLGYAATLVAACWWEVAADETNRTAAPRVEGTGFRHALDGKLAEWLVRRVSGRRFGRLAASGMGTGLVLSVTFAVADLTVTAVASDGATMGAWASLGGLALKRVVAPGDVAAFLAVYGDTRAAGPHASGGGLALVAGAAVLHGLLQASVSIASAMFLIWATAEARERVRSTLAAAVATFGVGALVALIWGRDSVASQIQSAWLGALVFVANVVAAGAVATVWRYAVRSPLALVATAVGVALSINGLILVAAATAMHGHVHAMAVAYVLLSAVCLGLLCLRHRAVIVATSFCAALLGVWGVTMRNAFRYPASEEERPTPSYEPTMQRYACPSLAASTLRATWPAEGQASFQEMADLRAALDSRADPYLPKALDPANPVASVGLACATGRFGGLWLPNAFRSLVLGYADNAARTCGAGAPALICSQIACVLDTEVLRFSASRSERESTWAAAASGARSKLRAAVADRREEPLALAFRDGLDECHDGEARSGPPGLCTRFTQSPELRRAVRRAWGLPEDCGECSAADVTRSGACRDERVETCERRLACFVRSSMSPEDCDGFADCAGGLETAVIEHALVAIGLRRAWWSDPVHHDLWRSVPCDEGRPPSAGQLACASKLFELRSWSPKFTLEGRGELAKFVGRGARSKMLMVSVAAGDLAAKKCPHPEQVAGLLGRVAIGEVESFARLCGGSDDSGVDSPSVILRIAAERLRFWTRAGACARWTGLVEVPLGTGFDSEELCRGLTQWQQGDEEPFFVPGDGGIESGR